MAHPAVLRKLLDRYETLQARQVLVVDGAVDPHLQRQLQDTSYTLCVSTGTRDVEAALAIARRHIAEAGLPPQPGTAAAV